MKWNHYTVKSIWLNFSSKPSHFFIALQLKQCTFFTKNNKFPGGLHVFPKEQKVPKGKCTCFLGNNKFPRELHLFPRGITSSGGNRTCLLRKHSFSPGNLLLLKENGHFPWGMVLFPWEIDCFLGQMVISPMNTCNSLRNN